MTETSISPAVQCSEDSISNSGMIKELQYSEMIKELSAARLERMQPLPFQYLYEDSLLDVASQFCLCEAVQESSGDLSDQFVASPIQEVGFDKAKSELVCNR